MGAAWVDDTEELDDGLRVEVGSIGDEDGDEDDADRYFEVLRGDGVVEPASEDVPSLITEQVMQLKVTRNAVHYLGGEDGHGRMVMEGSGVLQDMEYIEVAEAAAESHPYFAESDDRHYFRYDGGLYEVQM